MGGGGYTVPAYLIFGGNMGLSVREFEKRVKEIYGRWYVKARSVTIISDGKPKTFSEPIQVWERPAFKGPGFENDSLVMEIENSPNISHLKRLKKGHWQRTQNMQKSIFESCRDNYNEAQKRISTKTSYETKQYVLEHRGAFRETARRLGLSRGSIRDGLGV